MRYNTVKRGDVFMANLDPVIGSEQGGCRPVIILQNDVGNKYSPTTIVSAVTSRKKKLIPTHVNVGDSCISYQSIVTLEQLRTIDKIRLGKYLGHLGEETMGLVDNALKTSVGLSHKEKPLELTLCNACASSFSVSKSHYVRRVDLYQVEKEPCTICNVRRGFDYYVFRKSQKKEKV